MAARLTVFLFLVFFSAACFAQQTAKTASAQEYYAYVINIAEELRIFQTGEQASEYRISLCADVPNNKKPWKVAYNQETGHVFLVLQKISGVDTLNKVFGFYPRTGLPTLFFKTIASRIKDNSRREYDVEITKELTAAEFNEVLNKAVSYSHHKYHINKFNCYDYAVHIFNSVTGLDSLPVSKARFPFIFGKGGTPSCVYRDLKKLKNSNSVWAPYIRFGDMIAPVSSGWAAKAE